MNYYKKILLDRVSKKLICTNPDLIVHRGSIEELCAGSVAKVFEDLGGKVVYFGKPHEEIYNMCFEPIEKVLAIGDNLRTDIKGANNLNIDSIFITEVVHRKEFNNFSELNKLLEKYEENAKVSFTHVFKLPRVTSGPIFRLSLCFHMFFGFSGQTS